MTHYKKQSWSYVDMNAGAGEDSLLAALVLLTRYYQNPFSPESLIARLPLKGKKLTPKLFHRAAHRASLHTEIKAMEFDSIQDADLPLVLLLNDDIAYLLVLDKHNNKQLINPLAPEQSMSVGDAKKLYSGTVIVAKPEYKHSARSKELLDMPTKDWFWGVIVKSWPIYSEVLVAAFFINLFALVLPLFTMNVYDRVVPNKAISTMWILVSGVICVYVFDMLLKSLRAHFIDVASHRSDLALSASIFEQVLGIDMLSRPKSVGSFVNTVQSYEIFRDFITSSTLTIIIDLPFTLLFILVIYLVGGSLFWIPLLVIPTIFIIGFLIQVPLIKLTRESYQYAAEKQATLLDSLSNIETVKTVGAESVLQFRWERVVNLAAKTGMKLRQISHLSVNLTAFIQQLASVVVVICGVYKISDAEMTTGALIACTILTGRALAPMSQVASLFTRYFQAMNALTSLNKVMQLPTDVHPEMHYLHRPNLQGNIEFLNVNFNYQDEKLSALNNLNFKISSGERVAIIGRVGSGKSTLARLIMKIYTPTSGSILIDGTDYHQINPDELRAQIGYVPQDISLFYGTIRENITMGGPFVSDEMLLTASNIAGIGSFTNNHPKGLDRSVGERGSELSGGQRQAVAIARAFLANPHILIMDEPTSSMDVNYEQALKQRLKNHLTKDHTFILVTHKSSMLDLVDRIIVLDEGKVIADGPKDKVLLALQTGISVQKESI